MFWWPLPKPSRTTALNFIIDAMFPVNCPSSNTNPAENSMRGHLHKRCLNQSIKAEKLENHFWHSSLKCMHISGTLRTSLYHEVTSPSKPLLPTPAPRLKQVRDIRFGLQHRCVQNCANRSFQKPCPEILMCHENQRCLAHTTGIPFPPCLLLKRKKSSNLQPQCFGLILSTLEDLK